MLLAIDAGNTQTVIGVFDDDEDAAPAGAREGRPPPGLRWHWRVSTVSHRTADELAMALSATLATAGVSIPARSSAPVAPVAPGTPAAGATVSGIALSSSVPALVGAVREMAGRWFDVPLMVVEPGIKTGMPVLYENPREVGADRIVNAVAALELFGAPAIVVDLGTATTFDAISRDGEYLGGAIVPGIEISMDALFAHAAALRRVALGEPRRVIGRTTAESIQSGAVYGYAALVDGMCRRFLDEIGPAAVISTGGLAGVITPHATAVQHFAPFLTLHGLRLLYARNVEDEGR